MCLVAYVHDLLRWGKADMTPRRTHRGVIFEFEFYYKGSQEADQPWVIQDGRGFGAVYLEDNG
jgi:hypothetical protein